MEAILSLLCGGVIGGMICAAFYLGFRYGTQKEKESDKDVIELNEMNKDKILDYAEWMRFKGGNR